MKRQIIQIDEDKCNGCGLCANACVEGAIQMVDGKARLVSDVFCDGLGACLGECPVGAITVLQRDAEAYDERKTIENILPQGLNVARLHLEHLKKHGQKKLYEEGLAALREKGIEIPGMSTLIDAAPAKPIPLLPMVSDSKGTNCPSQSALPNFSLLGEKNWPIQLHLINPDSSVFDDAALAIAADCTAFSLLDFYQQFSLQKKLIVFCPKLDRSTEVYVEKLSSVFSQHDIRSIVLLRMAVPCCGGTSMIVRKALELSGKNIPVEERVVDFNGTIRSSR